MVATSEPTSDGITVSSGSEPTDRYRTDLGVLAHVLVEVARRRQDNFPGLLEFVQDALLITSGGTARRVYGWFDANAWRLRGWRVDEVFLNAEFLHHSEDGMNFAEGVLTTLLHEGTHAWANAQDVQDTSRDGRYHNRRFAEIALQLGLEVVRDPQIGHRTPGLTGWARHEYADLLRELDEGLTLSRPSRVAVPTTNGTNDETSTESTATSSATKKKYVFARCGCTGCRVAVTVRVALGSWRPGAIWCRECGQPFTESLTHGRQDAV